MQTVSNSLTTNQERNGGARTLSEYVSRPKVRQGLLGSFSHNEMAMQKFVTNIVSLASVRPDLQKCDYPTVISGALLATTLDLPLSPSLGFASLVPFEDKKNNRFIANFILQYKGYIQLAIRSGYYADIDVREVREGEYLGRDAMSGKPRFKFIEDDDEAEKLPVVGYMAYFEYLNGFKKVLYWTKQKMLLHADRYSPAFSLEATKGKYPKVSYADYEAGNYPTEDAWKYSSFWYKDFQAMAFKTMLRQLISKWGVMSIDMQKAFDADTKQMEGEIDNTAYSADDAKIDFFGNTDGLLPGNAGQTDFTKEPADAQVVSEESKTTSKGTKKAKENKETVAQADFFTE